MVFGEKIVKVGIISDTHGNESLFKKVIEKNIYIDTWIHAGDGASECGRMKELFSDKKFFFFVKRKPPAVPVVKLIA